MLVINKHPNYEGIIFKVTRFGEKRVSLEIVSPKPNKDGFVIKKFKGNQPVTTESYEKKYKCKDGIVTVRGERKYPLEAIHVYKKRTMTRDYFNKHFSTYDRK